MLLLLLQCLPCAWVTLSQARFGASLDTIKRQTRGDPTGAMPLVQRLGYLWNLPKESTASAGLGGGIAWAWDATLCEKLLPRFHEDLLGLPLVTCETLKAAAHRGFASWASNHPRLSFVDVTDECEAMGKLDRTCPLVELWVTALTASASSSSLTASSLTTAQAATLSSSEAPSAELASAVGAISEAQAEAGSSQTAATATPTARYQHNFYWTSGLKHPNGGGGLLQPMIETHQAVISFNVEESFCWYLDSTFCSGFHLLKRLTTPDTILILVRILVYSLWGAVLLLVAVQLVLLLRPQLTTRLTLAERLHKGLAQMATWSVVGTALRVLLIVTPPLFFELIFLPCFECFDFEAAVTHEVGHVLGFSHPDAVQTSACCGFKPGANVHHAGLAAGGGVDAAAFCVDPWRNVSEGVFAGATDLDGPMDGSVDAAPLVRPSIMKAFTQHTPRVCLTTDDLEGLNVLYPSCDTPLMRSPPICFKLQHNIGLVRLSAFILVPVILSLLLVTVVNALVRKHHLRRIQSGQLQIQQQGMHIVGVEAECASARRSVQSLTQQMQTAAATEDERVTRRANAAAASALAEYEKAVEQACGPGAADALRRVRADTEAGKMAAAAAATGKAPGRAPGRAPARRTGGGGGGGGGVINWMIRASGLDRFTGDRNTASDEDSAASDTPRAGGGGGGRVTNASRWTEKMRRMRGRSEQPSAARQTSNESVASAADSGPSAGYAGDSSSFDTEQSAGARSPDAQHAASIAEDTVDATSVTVAVDGGPTRAPARAPARAAPPAPAAHRPSSTPPLNIPPSVRETSLDEEQMQSMLEMRKALSAISDS